MNLDQTITQGQIAFALLVIAFALIYLAFKKSPRSKR